VWLRGARQQFVKKLSIPCHRSGKNGIGARHVSPIVGFAR